jgi:hypothetical protein
VVTGDLAYRQQVVHDHHDLPTYGHQGYHAPQPSLSVTIGGPACDRKSRDYIGGVQIASETRSTHR